MRKKGQVGVETVAKLVIVVVSLIVLLFLAKKVSCAIFATGGGASCQWNLLVHSSTKVGPFVNVPAQCKSTQLVVDSKRLETNYKYAEDRMEQIKNSPQAYASYPDIVTKFTPQERRPSPRQLIEYSANKVFADELKSCWDKVWKGKLPLFDEAWKLLGSDFFGGGTEDQQRERFVTKYTGAGGLINRYGPPTYCIVCSSVRLDGETKRVLQSQGVTSLTTFNDWLKTNPVPRHSQKISYYEYLIEGQTVKSPLLLPDFGTIDLDKQYAIVYQRINPHILEQYPATALGGVLGGVLRRSPSGIILGAAVGQYLDRSGVSADVLGDLPKAINSLVVLPYDKVAVPHSEDDKAGNCLYILD